MKDAVSAAAVEVLELRDACDSELLVRTELESAPDVLLQLGVLYVTRSQPMGVVIFGSLVGALQISVVLVTRGHDEASEAEDSQSDGVAVNVVGSHPTTLADSVVG